MPNAPDHLDPKEATEGRLCAYLEGELSPPERVDIENHLKANPQHRQLLTDLAQTRDWMRLIPKESAPADLAEAFSAHMERSMLLDDHTPTGGWAISRLPQYALLAAIVLLTLGLGVLIAVMLRSGQSNYTLAPAAAPMSSRASVSPATTPVRDEPASQPPDAVAAKRSLASPVPPAPPTAAGGPPDVQPSQKPALPMPAAVATDYLSDGADLARAAAVVRDRELASGRRTIGLLVSTPNPTATADQVRRFFTSNQVAFDDEQPLAAFGDVRIASAAPGVANSFAMKNAFGAGGVRRVAQNAAPQLLNDQNTGNQNDQLPQRPHSPGAADFAASGGRQQNALNAAPSTSPAPLLEKQDSAKSGGQVVLVGRSMTPLQLELLHGTLVTGGIDQIVKRLDLSEPAAETKAAAAATASGDSPTIAKGQSLTVTVPQLVGPGIEKTNLVKVADDGTINLPMLDPLLATGSTPAELEGRIAAKYKDANLIASATVTVTVNRPSTQPATRPMAVLAEPPTMLPASSQPASLTNPATQPVLDDKVDVVVFVQRSK